MSQDWDTTPHGAINLRDPEVINHFDAISSAIRKTRPICPVTGGGVILLSKEDVEAAFTSDALSNQPSRFSALAAKNADKYIAASVASHIPPFLDGPQHVAVRKWVMRAFFDRLAAFQPDIEGFAERHVAALDPSKEYVLIEDIARHYVVDVMSHFIGLTISSAQIKDFTSALFRLFAPIESAEIFAQTNKHLNDARTAILHALSHSRNSDQNNLLSLLDQAEGPHITGATRDHLIADNALLILADGLENVEAGIGLVMIRWAEGGHAPNAITDAFVYDTLHACTPGQTIARIARKPMVMGGEKIAAGSPVFLSLASANAQSDPDRSYTFGRGRHKCIGEKLAIDIITHYCAQLAQRAPDVITHQQSFAPMFGHKWPRRVGISVTR